MRVKLYVAKVLEGKCPDTCRELRFVQQALFQAAYKSVKFMFVHNMRSSPFWGTIIFYTIIRVKVRRGYRGSAVPVRASGEAKLVLL